MGGASPGTAAASELPLVERRLAATARPRRSVDAATPAQPVTGLRVLDLTRVIAGPVGTRMLAALGADVLRIDPPQMPELELAVLDTCPGKRLAGLDLRRPDDRATFEASPGGGRRPRPRVPARRPGGLRAG